MLLEAYEKFGNAEYMEIFKAILIFIESTAEKWIKTENGDLYYGIKKGGNDEIEFFGDDYVYVSLYDLLLLQLNCLKHSSIGHSAAVNSLIQSKINYLRTTEYDLFSESTKIPSGESTNFKKLIQDILKQIEKEIVKIPLKPKEMIKEVNEKAPPCQIKYESKVKTMDVNEKNLTNHEDMQLNKSEINTAAYWETRYASGKNSGSGSYGRLAVFKAEIINDFCKKHNINTVIEWGCGDGNQLSLMNYPLYTGLDVSCTVIELCREHYANDKSKKFITRGDYKIENIKNRPYRRAVLNHNRLDYIYARIKLLGNRGE